jgi:hypothetical protein
MLTILKFCVGSFILMLFQLRILMLGVQFDIAGEDGGVIQYKTEETVLK